METTANSAGNDKSRCINGIQRLLNLVRRAGLEPARCYPLAPQASASANSATSAWVTLIKSSPLLLLRRGRGLSLRRTLGRGHRRLTRFVTQRYGLPLCRYFSLILIEHAASGGDALFLGHDGQRQSRNHEQTCSNCSRLREDGVGAAWSENRLRSHTTECTSQISCLTTLKQHNNNEKEANHHVDKGDRYDSIIHTKIQYSK